MAKPIVLKEENYKDILADVLAKLKGMKSVDGVFRYSLDAKDMVDRKCVLSFTPQAYIKMMDLVHLYSTEVGWQGTMTRTDDGFLVEDVIVYPQQVTGATVNTDEKEYSEWMQGLPDEIFNNLRFHGHSHVNFGVYPSGTDTGDRERILSQLGPEDFYAFVIVNKKHEVSCAVYDMRENVLYETADVSLTVEGLDPDVFSFAKESQKLVKTSYQQTAANPAEPAKKTPAKAAEPKKTVKKCRKKDPDLYDYVEEGYDYERYPWLYDVYPGYGRSEK